VPSTAVPAPRPPAAARRRAWVWAPGALVACLAVAALVWFLLPPRVDFLPQGFEREGRAGVVEVGGKRVFKQIAYVLPDRDRVAFILVQPEDDLPPFYIMRNKVSNHAYRQIVERYPDLGWEPEWRKGGFWNNQDLGIDGKYLKCPVYRVSEDDAHRFARLLESNLAELPTPREWDAAGGRYRGEEGPFLKEAPRDGGNNPPFALIEQGPLEVGTATRDKSCYECRDMASNGREWTLCLADAPDQPIPFNNPMANPDVALRGVTYRAAKPFHFQDLDFPGSFRHPRFRPAGEVDYRDDISFRVVLHIPLGNPPQEEGTQR
jgi:hypothetical protein